MEKIDGCIERIVVAQSESLQDRLATADLLNS